MGLVRDVARNTLAMGAVQVASQFSTFILSVFLQYYIHNDYGYYSYAFALSSMVFIIADFGLGFQMVVDVAPNRSIASQYLTNTLYLRGVLGAVGVAITLLIALFSDLPQTARLAILIIGIATAFNWVAMVFTSILTAFEKMHYVLYTNLIERIFTVAVAIVMLLLGFGLLVVALVVLIGSLLNILLGLLVTTRRIVRPARLPDFRQAHRQLRSAIPYAASGVLVTSLYSLNGVLVMNLTLWTGGGQVFAAHSTAIYILAFNLVVALIGVPTVLITVLLPVISRMYKTSSGMTQLTLQKVMKYMFALGLPVTVGGILLSDRLIQFIYAPDFWDSAQVFRLLLPVIAISFFGTGISSVLASADRIRLTTVASGVAAAVNAALCFLLIPIYGAPGAAVAFTAAYLCMVVVGVRFLSREVFKIDLFDILARPVVAVVGMSVALYLLPPMHYLPAMVIGAVVYLILLFALGGIDSQDRNLLKKIMEKGT
ncbi:MAG: flippase [Methanomassiliicoccus sp.]|nr:flippase [Methanomassiliicoccus sp.]